MYFYEAVFNPSEAMNYNQDAKNLAGKRIAIQAGWIIKEGQFKGQECFCVPNSKIGWIPYCDLADLKPVPFVKCQEIHKSIGFSA